MSHSDNTEQPKQTQSQIKTEEVSWLKTPSALKWLSDIVDGHNLMSKDEEYRKEISSRLS